MNESMAEIYSKWLLYELPSWSIHWINSVRELLFLINQNSCRLYFAFFLFLKVHISHYETWRVALWTNIPWTGEKVCFDSSISGMQLHRRTLFWPSAFFDGKLHRDPKLTQVGPFWVAKTSGSVLGPGSVLGRPPQHSSHSVFGKTQKIANTLMGTRPY